MSYAPKSGNMITILIADDNPDDREVTRDALQECRLANDVHFVRNGAELLEYLRREGPYANLIEQPLPGLILLDLNMPGKDGREALKEIKADRDLRRIPVVVLTSSKADEANLRNCDLGVNSFVAKPVTFDSLVETLKTLGKYWFEIVVLPTEA